jgi:hypothetical protein
VLGWVRSIRFGEMRHGCAAKFKRPLLSLSLSPLFFFFFFFVTSFTLSWQQKSAVRAWLSGMPAEFLLTAGLPCTLDSGRELMREENHDFFLGETGRTFRTAAGVVS